MTEQTTKISCLFFRLFCALCWSLFIFTVNSLPAKADPAKPNILLLSSYHIGYKWSDEIYQGTLAALNAESSSSSLYVEYMDMKRHYSENRFEALYYSLYEKYKDIRIDYILSADDTAFIFLERYHHNLFPDATVIFCGTNYLEPFQLKGKNHFFGVTEKADIDATFDLMLSLHPDTERIYIINDTTVTGQKVATHINASVSSYQDTITFIDLSDLTMKELLVKAAGLPPKSLIFYTFFFRDNSGTTFEYNESISMIEESSTVPIYGVWDFNLGFGIVGGMLTSGYYQGQAAGELARRLIQGESPEDLPRLSESPNRYMFDYALLQKYDISIKNLPKEAIIINMPESFFEKHRKVLLFSAVFILLLLIIITALAINIGKRKKAERALLQSERNFRGVFENAVEGLFQVSLEGRFLRVNQSLAKMLKCDSPEDVLYHYQDLKTDLHVKDKQRTNIIQQVLDTGSAQLEVELFCKDRSKITVLLHSHEVVDSNGRHLYLEGSMTDMTEYKLTQEVIIQTEKMISLGGLSAGIAHEIKNPLTSMIQASHVVSERLLGESEANRKCAEELDISLKNMARYIKERGIPILLDNIMDAGKRAHIIVQDMLSFSKKTIGEFEYESLPDIINEAIELARKDYSLERGYNFNSIVVRQTCPEDIPRLYCSKSKLTQVLFNLLKNSAEAMAEAKTSNPRIDSIIEYDNEKIDLTIKDNGPGMMPHVREKIFEPFYTTKGRKKGTGLGLSISYFIITENHKGFMSVESSPGKGAAFYLQLPLEPKIIP